MISSTRNRSLWSLVYFIPLALLAGNAPAGVVSPLGARGHATLPEVQKFDPGGNDFQFGEGWRLRLGEGVGPNDVAVETLTEDLQSRFRVTLGSSGATGGHAKTERRKLVVAGRKNHGLARPSAPNHLLG